MNKRVMCVWLPNWPAQRATVAALQAKSGLAKSGQAKSGIAKSELSDAALDQAEMTGNSSVRRHGSGQNGAIKTENLAKPLILYRQDPRRGNVVAAANQFARHKGVLPQMPLSQCGPLCPDASVQVYEPQQDLEALIELAEQSQCYSPIVGLEPLAEHPWAGRALLEPQCLILETTGLACHFGGEEALAKHVRNWLLNQGFLTSVAIGDSVGQAWALANYAYRRQISDGMLEWERIACSATDSTDLTDSAEKQSYLRETRIPCWITIGGGSLQENSQLRSLPIEALRLDLLTASKLHRLGVRSIDQLLALPRTALPSRFGEGLITQLDNLEPTSKESFRSLTPSASLCSSRSFEYPTPYIEEVCQVIEEQLVSLSKELSVLQLGALRITSRISVEKSAIDNSQSATGVESLASVLQVSFFQPTDDAQHMFWLLRAQLESKACRVNDAYRAKEILTQVTLTSPIVWKQNDLFEGENVKHRDAIAKLIDHMSVRLGRENVLAPALFADPAPEHSYRWRPMTGLRKDGSAQETKKKLRRAPKRDYQEFSQDVGPSPAIVWRRPVRLFGDPVPLAITEMASNQLPAIVRYPKANTTVCDAQGPERIQTGWWAGAMLQRDYYRMQLQNGIWLWCFLDLKSRQWFVHGVFD